MAAEKPNSAKPNPRRKMKKIGLHCKLLNRSLHSGGCSTCPPKYSDQSGSNGIVDTALSGNQIISNNLNSDNDDNVITKSKTYHYNDIP